jgi:hypothetical protein
MTETDPAIDALVRSFYEAFDNRGSRAVDAEALYALFAPTATIVRLAAGRPESMRLPEFIEPRLRLLREGALTDFHEWEVDGGTTILGEIASHWSLYAKEGLLDGRPYSGGGRKLLHLCRHGREWLIASLLWHDD